MTSKKVKTICFFNSNKAWGGGEKWHFSTALELKKRGFNTFLVTNKTSALAEKCAAAGLPFFPEQVSNLSFLNPLKVYKLASFFKEQQTDVVVLNLSSDVKLAGIAARLAGVQKIIYRRGMPHPIRNTWLNRLLFKDVLTHVIANSEEVSRSLQQQNEAWFPKEKIVILNNGVDLKAPLNLTDKLYQKQGNEIVIGNAGRLTHQKGQVYLIEMAKALKAKNINFKLLIAGEGELKEALQQQIKEQGLENQIQLLGHVHNMGSFFNSLDIFVFPSLFEGSANTLIEVLHHQIPTVAFNISSNPEIIVHGQNGFLATPFDTNQLADYVTELIQSKTLRDKFIRNGLQVLSEKFDKDKNMDQFQALITS